MLISYPRIESDDTRYAYAVGRIRALETKLLSAHRIARLLEAKDGAELLHILQDTDYSLTQDPRDYETTVRNARIELYRVMNELIIDSVFLKFSKLKYDYHNVKVLLKGTIGGKEVANLLSDFGNIPINELKSVFTEERYDKLPYGLQSAIGEAISTYYLTKDPRFLDIILDKSYYSFLTGLVKNDFLATLIRIEIDLTNIKTLLRIKWLKVVHHGEERTFFIKAFIPGGWLQASRFLDSFDEPLEVIPHWFDKTPYSRILNEGVEFLHSKESFSRLEKLCDDYIISFCKVTRYLAFGVEPVLAYFYGKENEFKILRMLFIGKLNAIPDQMIKERLPEAY